MIGSDEEELDFERFNECCDRTKCDVDILEIELEK
jgi:hypothetical protein